MTNEEAIEYVPANVSREDAISVFSKLADFAIESQRNKTERRRIDAMERMMIEQITTDYKKFHATLTATFAERSKVIEKQFEVIDKGMRENNDILILGGLKCLSDVVKNSPFANFATFREAFDQGTLPPI
ncbi:MAG: hypothetical protein Ta2B_14750 [Termitinemataceae bacterium]|nr:MAG: hypothetical protein Ta2B_14750 [Termitinemataceae bacterium]